MAPALNARDMEIIGHRGASFDAPENTLSSFKLGYQQNADAVELDIHMTKDGRVVALHDTDTRRTAGTSDRVSERTFAELSKLDVGQWGRWKGKGFSERIPALEEVLEIVPDGKRLLIEIKCGPEVLLPLARILEKGGKKPQQIVLMDFDYGTVKTAKERFPAYPVYWLLDAKSARKSHAPAPELIGKVKAASLDGLDVAKDFPFDRAFVQAVHEAGLKIFTWTVDDVATARLQAAVGVDGITTNRPGWLREQLLH